MLDVDCLTVRQTLAGLNTVNLSEINTWQQIILFFLIMLGSAILVSLAVVEVRRKAFERRFETIYEEKRKRRERSNIKRVMSFPLTMSRRRTTSQPGPQVDGVVVRGSSIKEATPLEGTDNAPFENPGNHPRAEQRARDRPKLDLRTITEDKPNNNEHPNEDSQNGPKSPGTISNDAKSPTTGIRNRISFATPMSPSQRPHKRVFTFQGVGARQDLMNLPTRAQPRPEGIPPTPISGTKPTGTGKPHQFEWSMLAGRNSQFSSLTLAEREQLGGVEYRAIEVLVILVPLYFVLWQFLAALSLGAYIAHNRPDIAESNGLNPWFVLS